MIPELPVLCANATARPVCDHSRSAGFKGERALGKGEVMRSYQQRFIDLSVASTALRFGRFTLKSGRVSPYFFNAGQIHAGAALWQLGRCYAELLTDRGPEFDVLFGPAYKGIPLAAATACALAEGQGRDVGWAYNRKEAKAHGEGGMLVGAELAGRRVLVVDDVITAGTAIREVAALLEGAGAQMVGVAVGLDRQERGQGSHSAIEDVQREFGVPVLSLITLANLIDWVASQGDAEALANLRAYRARYGVEQPPKE